MTICVMVSSLLYVVANVELNRLHKKEKGETQYETPKPLNSKTPPFIKKTKTPAHRAADAWQSFSPGWCYQPGLNFLLPGRPSGHVEAL